MFGFGRKELKEYDYSKEELAKFNYAKITTEKGVIFIKLFNEETPNTVANFATLANDGFYNNLNFHRVIPGFMAQGGCPEGSGMGGPDWAIACETDAPKQVHNKGSLSMAHAGPNTGGSQFFICFVITPHQDQGFIAGSWLPEPLNPAEGLKDYIRCRASWRSCAHIRLRQTDPVRSVHHHPAAHPFLQSVPDPSAHLSALAITYLL